MDVIDGETIVMGTRDRVRIVGIEAPAPGQPCADRATHFLIGLLAGEGATLTRPPGLPDKDVDGRLLRYVDHFMPYDSIYGPMGTIIDVGRAEIAAGLVAAGDDSLDGHPRHPRQDDYRALDASTPPASC